MDNADSWRDPNPWHPMTDSVACKHLGKLQEELGECIAAVARCQIQGIDEKEPVTGKVNREWLQDEIADVLANCQLNIEHFNLNLSTIQDRIERKKKHLRHWHSMV